jgi:hypothetical protein
MEMSEERTGRKYLYISQRSAPNATASHAAVIAAKLAVQDFEEGSAEPDAVEQQVGIRNSSWQDNLLNLAYSSWLRKRINDKLRLALARKYCRCCLVVPGPEACEKFMPKRVSACLEEDTKTKWPRLWLPKQEYQGQICSQIPST